MSEPIKPALTPEEWKDVVPAREGYDDDIYGLAAPGMTTANLHALAALALYGQPFGFRHHQVSWLREEAEILRRAGAGAGALMCNEIADRIEALLPRAV